MFGYYGAKTNVVKYYPPPAHDMIIEPFAGSARYALKYFDREVLLIDKYETIIGIWKWLQQCSPRDILTLPDMKQNEHLSDFTFDCPQAKDFMGFVIGYGLFYPNTRPSKHTIEKRPNLIKFSLERIAGELHKIKHWTIVLGDYHEAPDQPATWFIDPPYQFGGHKYIHGSQKIDYPELRSWAESRQGQVIVCENAKATWMNFVPVKNQRTSKGVATECLWTNMPTSLNSVQLKLM